MVFSTLPIHKRNKVVYGKLGSRAKYGSYISDDEKEEGTTSKPAVAKPASAKVSAVAQEPTERKAHPALKHARPRAKRIDTFDVPSSEDESSAPSKTATPPRIRARKPLVDDTISTKSQLAPWEQKRVAEGSAHNKLASGSNLVKRADTSDEHSPAKLGTAVKRDQRHYTAKPAASNRSSTQHGVVPAISINQHVQPSSSSAAARLAARRKERVPNDTASGGDSTGHESRNTHKRPPSSLDESDERQKRPRTGMDTGDLDNEMEVEQAWPEAANGPTKGAGAELDVFDFPESTSAGVSKSQTNAARSSLQYGQQTRKREAPTGSSSQRLVTKGGSAPDRLTAMIATGADTPEAPTRSPSPTNSRTATPQLPSTPTSASNGSPRMAIKAAGALTPKQARLWDRLLPSHPPAPSPSTLPMDDLEISERRRGQPHASGRTLIKSKSDVGRRRTKLVDRLKASAPTTEDDRSEDEDTEIVDADRIKPTSEPNRSQDDSQHSVAPASQPLSQGRGTQGRGLKITYASARSFLPEDSLEDELMLGPTSDMGSQPRGGTGVPGRSGVSTQQSEFDLDDSDEGEPGGKLRTIHELRAAGRSIRTMEDIDGLFRDIENHNASNRSRRRSALAELATKLTTKAFVERFTSHSFELQLIAECTASPDSIADFALAASLALLFASSIAEESLSAMRDRGVLDWLTKLLTVETDVRKLVRDRANNMSRASQASFLEFTDSIKRQPQLWEGKELPPLTPRLLALKGLELLVKKLRQSGDKTSLLTVDQCEHILPPEPLLLDGETLVEVETAISLLELLSTSSSTLGWPPAMISRVAELLPRLQPTSPQLRNIFFLNLRLCLNLTNLDVHNCNTLATEPVVQFLLHSVKDGFATLESKEADADADARTVALDLLVLAMGIIINLAEHSDQAREHARVDEALLKDLIRIFQHGQKRMLEAESVEESISNVAYGYLAVGLANLCQNALTRKAIAAHLPKQNLAMLIEAVAEFVAHHQQVDMMNFEGEEGMEVWGAFTEKLKAVLERLKAVAAET